MEEQQKEAIRKQAEKILDKFGKSLESVKLKEKKIEGKVGGFRKEATTFNKGSRSPNDNNCEFRKRMFENAPDKNDDFLIAEKKSW